MTDLMETPDGGLLRPTHPRPPCLYPQSARSSAAAVAMTLQVGDIGARGWPHSLDLGEGSRDPQTFPWGWGCQPHKGTGQRDRGGGCRLGSWTRGTLEERQGRSPAVRSRCTFCLQFEAFCAGDLAPGWSLTV
jgi:hypothetical protein